MLVAGALRFLGSAALRSGWWESVRGGCAELRDEAVARGDGDDGLGGGEEEGAAADNLTGGDGG